MAGMTTGTRGVPQAEPNVVPMIDILLVLLIIFMIAQPLSRTTMEVKVPPMDNQPTPENAPPTQIVLELTATGYAINGQPIPKEQLGNQIRAIYEGRPAKVMFITAAENRIYQEVIEAMDIARGAGVVAIGFTPQEAN